MPGIYETAREMNGCRALDAAGGLKFVMGHQHCNKPHPHGHVGQGFMVAGQGMEGCGNYGVPVLDTTGGRVRFWYFSVASLGNATASEDGGGAETGTDTYEEVHTCVAAHGWRACTHLASSWLDEPLPS